jgi:hypothetical protein
MCDAGTRSRVTRFACGSMSRTMPTPCAIVFAVPPVSWMLNVRSSGPSFRFCAPKSALIWFASQPRPTTSTPAKFACRA